MSRDVQETVSNFFSLSLSLSLAVSVCLWFRQDSRRMRAQMDHAGFVGSCRGGGVRIVALGPGVGFKT